MSEEQTAVTENQNDATAITPDTGTAPEQTGVETLLSGGETGASASEGTGTAPEESVAKASDENKDEAPKESEVPDVYEFQDVGDIQVDDAVKSAFAEVARGLSLSQDKAQEVINKMAPAIHQAQQAQLSALTRQWADESKSDPEFGGSKFLENMGLAKKAFDTFGTPELMRILNASGLGNHKDVIRVFWKIGKEMSVDKIHTGGNARSVTGDKLADMASRIFT